jgi:hypothetical protein
MDSYLEEVKELVEDIKIKQLLVVPPKPVETAAAKTPPKPQMQVHTGVMKN